MAEKAFLQTFEDFEGLDYRSTPLTDDLKGAQQLTNYQHSEGKSVRGRNGIQGLAQAGAFVGTFNYSYFDADTGATTEELLAINDNLWKLSSTSMLVSIVAGSTIRSWNIRVNSATNTFRFVLNQNGTPVTLVHPVTGASNAYLDLGSGLEGEDVAVYNPSLVTVWDLYEAINNTANFAIVTPPSSSARVNGIQNNVSAIVVDAGHTIAVGDVITLWDHATAKLVARTVTATAAALITFNSTYGTVSVKDNQVLGKAATPATSLLVADTASGVGGLFLTYYYWSWVPNCLDPEQTQPFATHWANRTSANFKPPCFLNMSQCCYIATEAPTTTLLPHESYVHKYDGQRVYRIGLPRVITASAALAAGALTGAYKWRFAFAHKDKRGIYVEGEYFQTDVTTLAAQQATWSFNSLITQTNPNLTDILKVNGNQVGVTNILVLAGGEFMVGEYLLFLDRSTGLPAFRTITAYNKATDTITISGAAVNVNDTDTILRNFFAGSHDTGAAISGVQANVTTINVTAGHSIIAGDVIFLHDTYTGTYVERTVTSVTTTTITISGTTVSVTNATARQAIISRNMRMVIYRTKAGGNVFYKVEEISITGTDPNTLLAWIDNNADSALGVQFETRTIGREQDPPPRAGVIVQHQGSMIFTRIFGQPNTIASSLPGIPEYVPLASNYFDIPSTVIGSITATYSDTESSLATFKDNAYYSVEGDLDSYAFTIKTVKEGDYGISSQASIQKILDTIIGVGKLGFVSIKGGALVSDTGNNVDPAVWNNPNIRLSQAVSCNDYVNRQYRCYIPDTSGFGSAALLDNSLMFVLDYANEQAWFDWSYNPAFAPSGGITINSNTVYHVSKSFGKGFGTEQIAVLPGHLFREYKDLTDTTLYYWDNNYPPSYTYTTEWESLGQPSLDKEFLRFKVFSFAGPYETRANFDLTVTTYRNYQLTTPDSQFTLSFSASTDYEKFSKLKSGKARALAVKMVTNTGGQAPYLSGLELLVAAPYFKEDIAK